MSKESCTVEKKKCPCILNEKEWLEGSERKAQKRDRIGKRMKGKERKKREIANH